MKVPMKNLDIDATGIPSLQTILSKTKPKSDGQKTFRVVEVGTTTTMVDTFDDSIYFTLESLLSFSKTLLADENIKFWIAVDTFTKSLLPKPTIDDSNQITVTTTATTATTPQSNHQNQSYSSSSSSDTRYQESFNLGKKIMENYIIDNSPSQINLDHQVRAKIIQDWDFVCNNNKMGMIPASIFAEASVRVFQLIEQNVYPRYVEYIQMERLKRARRQDFFWFTDRGNWSIGHIFSFPTPINEADSMIHAGCTFTLITVAIALDVLVDWKFLYWYICYGFAARFLSGPKFDIQSFIVRLWLRPLVQSVFRGWPKDKFKSGIPRRFAQSIGTLFSLSGTLLCYHRQEVYAATNGSWFAFYLGFILLSVLGILQLLLFVTGFCAGCWMFSLLMRAGIIPQTVCQECQTNYCTIRM